MAIILKFKIAYYPELKEIQYGFHVKIKDRSVFIMVWYDYREKLNSDPGKNEDIFTRWL